LAVVVLFGGPICEEDVQALCERVRLALQGSVADEVICDVGALDGPDVGTLDALARVQLTAVRLGGRIRLRRACVDLRDLLVLAGLCEVLPLCGD
jgi:hypothetical protein